MIIVFKDGADTSENPRTIGVICWEFEEFVSSRTLTAESSVTASEKKKDALLSSMNGGLYELCVHFKSNQSIQRLSFDVREGQQS